MKECEHCDDCLPIGKDSFICIKEIKPKVVIENYAPTIYYGRCIKGEKHKKKGNIKPGKASFVALKAVFK